MTTYALATGSGGYPSRNKSGAFRIEAEVDFSKVNSGNGTVQNDIIQALSIPANTFVQLVYYKVSTASANLDDLDIGDGATADGYVDGLDMESTGDGTSWNTTLTEGTPNTTVEAFSLGKFYTTADTIDLKQNTNDTVVTGVIKVGALCFDCNPAL